MALPGGVVATRFQVAVERRTRGSNAGVREGDRLSVGTAEGHVVAPADDRVSGRIHDERTDQRVGFDRPLPLPSQSERLLEETLVECR